MFHAVIVLRLLTLVLVLVLAVPAWPATAGEGVRDPAAELAELKGGLARADRAYRRGEPESARQAVVDGFARFESTEVHDRLAVRSPALYRELESEWVGLAALAREVVPYDRFEARCRRLERLLEQARAETASTSDHAAAAFNAFLIILREGLEALLIIAALAAYLRKVGRADRLRHLWVGAAAAGAASLGLWLVARGLVRMSGAAREAIEGGTMLLATAVLFWVSYWLISRAEAARWQAFVREQVAGALRSERTWALAVVSFLVVFREGFETVLFYEALLGDAGGGPVALGLCAGILALGLVYLGMSLVGRRIPLRPFFAITGGLLYLLAFKFAGDGVVELQEALLVPATRTAWVPDLPWAAAWLGIHPTVESAMAQALLVVAAVAALVLLALPAQANPQGGGEDTPADGPAGGLAAPVAMVALGAWLGFAVLARTDAPWAMLPEDGLPAEMASLRNPLGADPAALAVGRALFAAHCASCHGEGGAGDGPASRGLDPAPADLRGPTVRRHTDAYLHWRLKRGKKGTAMPSFDASLNDQDRWALIAHLRERAR
ncbi:MAG: FTR1 family protein [Planctomycetes bacterium]|nr:FTR1 family protein [Planctomycetota bacterium]